MLKPFLQPSRHPIKEIETKITLSLTLRLLQETLRNRQQKKNDLFQHPKAPVICLILERFQRQHRLLQQTRKKLRIHKRLDIELRVRSRQ